MMSKISISIEISQRDYNMIKEGTELLTQHISYERSLKGKGYIQVDESYYLTLAIYEKLTQLKSAYTENNN